MQNRVRLFVDEDTSLRETNTYVHNKYSFSFISLPYKNRVTMSSFQDETSPMKRHKTAKSDAGGTKTSNASPRSYIANATSPDSKLAPIVQLNVGGTLYKVSRDTLMRYEDSMLANLVSGKWKEGEGDDEIFIDRNGRRFEWVLDYLRSDRVYVPSLSDQSALKDEFDFFGIDADMSKVSVVDDFMSIEQLTKEIKEHKGIIEHKKKKIAAMKESYKLAGRFANAVDRHGTFMEMTIEKDVDQDLLSKCLLSRGLHLVSYASNEAGAPVVNVCPIGEKHHFL